MNVKQKVDSVVFCSKSISMIEPMWEEVDLWEMKDVEEIMIVKQAVAGWWAMIARAMKRKNFVL